MKDYDAMEQAYKNGYIDGFRNGLNKIEECLQKYGPHKHLPVNHTCFFSDRVCPFCLRGR